MKNIIFHNMFIRLVAELVLRFFLLFSASSMIDNIREVMTDGITVKSFSFIIMNVIIFDFALRYLLALKNNIQE